MDEEDRRRELALNWIIIASVLLAFFEAAIRASSVIEGGAAASTTGRQWWSACSRAAPSRSLLVLSRRGRQVVAAWCLLGAYYAVITWLFAAEGTEESAAIVLCTMMVVTGGVLLGTRVSLSSVLLIAATALIVDSLDHAGVIHLPAGHDAPSVFGQLGICGGLAALALVLSARTVERRGSVGDLLSGADGGAPVVSSGLVTTLTVRELQVVRLIAAGRSNERDRSRAVPVSANSAYACVQRAAQDRFREPHRARRARDSPRRGPAARTCSRDLGRSSGGI